MNYSVECVPNFSEGRDAAKVRAIVDAVQDGPEVVVLDTAMDRDHNRSVITFAGTPEGAREAALRAIERAAALIDLSRHEGVHPRIGAADVVPFVPLAGSSIEECVAIAEFVAEQAWNRFGLPTYLYGAAARREERRNLESVRRGWFEGLREEVKVNPDRKPDFGGSELHPTAGATVVGARDFLIAFNVNLNTPNAETAKAIAKRVRASDGGLPGVKALGLFLASRNIAQVSLNVTDFKATSLWEAFESVEREAQARGTKILESELVGLIPCGALAGAPHDRMKIRGFNPDMILENRLARLL